MHIVTGLSKELLPPSGEVESGGDGSGAGMVGGVLPLPVHEEQMRSRVLCSPEKRDLAAAVWGVVLAKKEPSGPLRVGSGRAGGNGCSLNQGRFQLDVRERSLP